MKKKSSYSFGCGLFIAPLIIVALLWLFSPSSPKKDVVTQYINESKNIELKIDTTFLYSDNDWVSKVVGSEGKKFVSSIAYYFDFRRKRWKYYALIYSSSYKKYFVIENYKRDYVQIGRLRGNKQLFGMVNLKELADKAYGTKANPVPVLWLTDFALSEPVHYDFYFNSVTDYLRFFKNRRKYNHENCAVCPY